MRFPLFALTLLIAPVVHAAETQSIRPGINEMYLNPNLDAAQMDEGFSSERRDAFRFRKEIVAAMGLKPGMNIADVGAGTGIFLPLFSADVGPTGKVYAVDISKQLVAFIERHSKEQGLTNVTPVLGEAKTTNLPANSLDVLFTCDVYHHFEFPQTILADIRRALKDGGSFIIVDYHRAENAAATAHVRATQKQVIAEVMQAGFPAPEEIKIPGLEGSYFLRFKK